MKDLLTWLLTLVVVECFLALTTLTMYIRINHEVRWSNVIELESLQNLLFSWPGMLFGALGLGFLVYWIKILFRMNWDMTK